MNVILPWIFVSLSMLGIAHFLPNYLSINPWWMCIIAGAAYMFVKTIIKPIISIFTLPINIITLGTFSIVINAVLFWSLSLVVDGFVVSGIVGALISSCIMSVIYFITKKIFKD